MPAIVETAMVLLVPSKQYSNGIDGVGRPYAVNEIALK
jgi:hypothetical protein